MSEIEHTPWKAVRASHGPIDIFDSRGYDIVTLYGEDKEHLANLFSAAPELLEALLWCKSQGWLQYAKRIPNQNAAFCDDVDKAIAAIAKATGSQS